MKFAESQNQYAEQNPSYCSFFDLGTSPLLLYYYIIIYGQRHISSRKTSEKIKNMPLHIWRKSRPKQKCNTDGECLKSSKKDDEGFLKF